MRPGRIPDPRWAGGLWLAHDGGKRSDRAAVRSGSPSVVVAHPLTEQVVDWNEFSGRFEPTSSIEIRARVSGHLQAINFTDGQMVEVGQVLFSIYRRPYQATVAEAEAQLASARAQLELANLELRRPSTWLYRSANVSRFHL